MAKKSNEQLIIVDGIMYNVDKLPKNLVEKLAEKVKEAVTVETSKSKKRK